MKFCGGKDADYKNRRCVLNGRGTKRKKNFFFRGKPFFSNDGRIFQSVVVEVVVDV